MTPMQRLSYPELRGGYPQHGSCPSVAGGWMAPVRTALTCLLLGCGRLRKGGKRGGRDDGNVA
jgi:hypothetical protein